jgi:hypothetical protein
MDMQLEVAPVARDQGPPGGGVAPLRVACRFDERRGNTVEVAVKQLAAGIVGGVHLGQHQAVAVAEERQSLRGGIGTGSARPA